MLELSPRPGTVLMSGFDRGSLDPRADHTAASALATLPPSWIDRLIHWIDRLPGPVWLFYALAVLATAALINVVLWIDGSVPIGAAGAIQGIIPPIVFYFLALYHYLTRVAARSLSTFRPLLELDETEMVQATSRLTELPRWMGWLAVPLGFATTPPYFLGDRIPLGDFRPHSALPYFVAVSAAGFFAASFLCVVIRSARQLRMVHDLHARARNINLLDLRPAHAFSKLTAVTGSGVVLVVILGYIYNPSVAGSAWVILTYLLIATLALVVFVVPVIGLRGRLEQEKAAALSRTSDLLQTTNNRFQDQVERGQYDNLERLDNAISTLIRQRELLSKISTWPWEPRTFRSFASTLLLPIFVWLATRLLGRYI